MKKFILFSILIFLSGCSNKVQVVDIHGIPIKNAKVVPVTLSMNGKYVLTNSSGYANIPSHINGQEVKWIQVECAGYTKPQFPTKAIFPLCITLKKP